MRGIVYCGTQLSFLYTVVSDMGVIYEGCVGPPLVCLMCACESCAAREVARKLRCCSGGGKETEVVVKRERERERESRVQGVERKREEVGITIAWVAFRV